MINCYRYQDFWGVLTPQGEVLNWDGGLSPVVHQLDHFLGELEDMYDTSTSSEASVTLTSMMFRKKSTGNVNTARTGKSRGVGGTSGSGSGAGGGGSEGREADGKDDRGWQAVKVSKCLWGCPDSPVFVTTAATTTTGGGSR
jgi:hypothetical protein